MNSTIPNQDSKQYLYAITLNTGEQHYGTIGIDEQAVYSINNGPLAAIVSPVATKGKIRPQRRNLAAHQQVIKQVMINTTPLPVTFGIIADNTQTIHDLLTHHQPALLEQLQKVAGKVEMGLRVIWNVPNIFEYFVNTHESLRELRDRAFDGQSEPTRDEMITIGYRFNQLLEQEREAHTAVVEQILSTHCFEIRRNKCRDEREVMNLVCLVGQTTTSQKAFENSIYETAKLFNDDFMFDYNGPWAPHHFVHLNIELGNC